MLAGKISRRRRKRKKNLCKRRLSNR